MNIKGYDLSLNSVALLYVSGRKLRHSNLLRVEHFAHRLRHNVAQLALGITLSIGFQNIFQPRMTYEADSGTSAATAPFVKPDLSQVLSVHDFEAIASKTFTPKAWAFISSAATDLYTKSRNASTYSKITLRPRILRDVSNVDLSTQLLGHKLRMPIFASPTAMAAVVHPEGEKSCRSRCQGLWHGALHLHECIFSAQRNCRSHPRSRRRRAS